MISVTKQVLDGKSAPVKILDTNKYTVGEIVDAIKYDYIDEIVEGNDDQSDYLLSDDESDNESKDEEDLKRDIQRNLISILVDYIQQLNELVNKLDTICLN